MNGLISLFKSFGYAFRGIYQALKYERNMRIHLVCIAYMYSFLLVYDFFKVSPTQFALIFLANAMVMAAELINTAVERTVDLASDKKTENGKLAKDAAAGAVLVCAIFAVLVGIAVLFQPQAFAALYNYYVEKPFMFLIFLISIALSTVFIFKGFGKSTADGNKTKRNGK